MSDLVKRLRGYKKTPVAWAAADEIEKLRAALNTFVAAVPKDCVLVSRVATEQMDARIVAFETENEKLRAALQWLVNDLQDYPASARPIAAYDNALKVLGEKE